MNPYISHYSIHQCLRQGSNSNHKVNYKFIFTFSWSPSSLFSLASSSKSSLYAGDADREATYKCFIASESNNSKTHPFQILILPALLLPAVSLFFLCSSSFVESISSLLKGTQWKTNVKDNMQMLLHKQHPCNSLCIWVTYSSFQAPLWAGWSGWLLFLVQSGIVNGRWWLFLQIG